MASCYPVLPSSYTWAEVNGEESLQAYLMSHTFIFYLLKWADNLSNLARHWTGRDALQQLLATAKYLLGLKKGENARVQLRWRGISRRFWKLFKAGIHDSFYCCFFVDLQNEELAPMSISHFCKPKAFLGISKGWADKSVNLAIGDIQVYWVNPALCSSCVLHFRTTWFLTAFHFKEWLVIFTFFTKTRVLQLNSLK